MLVFIDVDLVCNIFRTVLEEVMIVLCLFVVFVVFVVVVVAVVIVVVVVVMDISL